MRRIEIGAAQRLGQQLQEIVALLEARHDVVQMAGADVAQALEQTRSAAQVQAAGIVLDDQLEGRPQRAQEGTLGRTELVAGEGRVDRAGTDLLAGQALVQVDAGEVGEALVDRAFDAKDAFGDVARGGDHDDHHDVRLQGEHLDVAHGCRGQRWRRDDGQQLGRARQGFGRLFEGIVDLAADADRIEGQGARVVVLLDDRVDVVAVAGVGRHAPGRRVGMVEQAQVLERRQVVADGRGRDAERVRLEQELGPDRRARGDELLDHRSQDELLSGRQSHSCLQKRRIAKQAHADPVGHVPPLSRHPECTT